MAPEVLNGADPTPASDVYSYAMFLVELMTRDRPFGVRALEPKGGTDESERRTSEVSVATEFERRPFSESVNRRGSEISEGTRSVDQAVPVQTEGGESGPKQTGGDENGKSDRRVSWSVAAEAPAVRASTSETDGYDDVTAPEIEAFGNTLQKVKDKPSKEASRRDFYAVVNGETLSRDDIVDRVKDLSLDPPFRPTLPDNAPDILRTICTEAWSKNPRRRPTMKEIEERLAAALSSKTLMQQLMRRGSVFDSILPPDVQDKLAHGEAVKPQTYDNVTVIFSGESIVYFALTIVYFTLCKSWTASHFVLDHQTLLDSPALAAH